MLQFTLDELRRLSKIELRDIKKAADKGDVVAICKMALCIIYAQSEEDMSSCLPYLEKASAAGNSLGSLLLGYVHEHAMGASKDYAKSIENYSRAYDLLAENSPSKSIKKEGSKALKEMERRYDKLVQQVLSIVTTKNFCVFQKERFTFPWTAETRKKMDKLLPQLSKDMAEFGHFFESAITNLQNDEQGRWEFAYQDTLLLPLEVMKTLAARDYLGRYLEVNGFHHLLSDPYFDNALGRCLIDDDNAKDFDYIIGGLLNMAGHEESPLWQYRVGLWYEYSDLNHEPKTAAYWYELAASGSTVAKEGLKRIKNKLEYRILDETKVGTVSDCKTLYLRSSKNPLCSMDWMMEGALRGDESAIKRLGKIQSFASDNNTIFGNSLSVSNIPQPFYSLMEEESSKDKKARTEWYQKMQEEKEYYRKLIAEEERKKLEAERRRLEAERKAKEEAIRKAREAEEAKRRAEEAKRKAEEEAKRRAEEAKRRAEAEAIRKAKEAEEAKRRAEEEARRKAREAEEAERQRKEEEKRRQAEEAERRRLEEEKNRKEAAAWNALQSCSNEDIEKYGISIISFARGKKPTIYYRGYSFICQEEITKIKNHLDVKNFLILFAEKGGKGILEVKDYKRKDFDTYYKENSKTLAEAENFITFCSESDLLRILRKREHLHVRRIAQEMQLIPLCFDSNKDSAYSIEYQNLFCDAEIGGGVYEILQAGFIGDHREPIDSDLELIPKKLSPFEVFSHLWLGATVQYKILIERGFDDTVLLSVYPFDINAEVWVNGRYRDCLKLIECRDNIPCKATETVVDDNCSSIILSLLGKRFALDVPKLFGHFPKSFEITCDVDANGIIMITLKDKESKKEVSIRDELFDYEESGMEEDLRHAREAEEAKHKAEEAERKRLEAERKAKEEAIRKAKEAEEARQRAEEEARRKAEEARDAWEKGFLYYGQNKYKEAIKCFLKAAEYGQADAQFHLGVCYRNGNGVGRNYKEAIKWFRKAAEQGHVDAQFQLGLCYSEGNGVDRDYGEAVKWFRKAAEQGHADAQFQLGACYRDGDGVDRDYKEAIRLFRKAADQGHARAQNAIGRRYLFGEGVSKDPTEAVKWFRKAAEQNLDMAQRNIGDCYKDGIGVVKNNKEAIRWYRKAAEQGDVYAQSELEDLEQLSFGMKFLGVISLLPCLLAWGSSFVLGRSWSIGIFFMLFMAALVFFFQGFRVHMSEMDNSQRPIYIIQFILLLLSCGIIFLL